MITCELVGGLGNNLFQLAAIYCLSKKHGIPYCIQGDLERRTFDGKLLKYDSRIKQTHVYEIPKIFQNDFSFLSLEEIRSQNFDVYNHPDLQGSSGYKELPVLDNTIYRGYFQSDKYFNGIDLSKEWKLNTRVIEGLQKQYGRLFEKPTISIQYRLGGDRKMNRIANLYKTVPPSYYEEAISKILDQENKNLDDYNILLFSDDLDMAKDLILEVGINAHQVNNNNSILDFIQMTMCTHNVIGNSTYAWWSAHLNVGEEKIVVAPKTFWFGKDSGYSNFNLDDLFPSTWITL